ncbi:MAG: RNA polymerase sigma factor RpoD, partial [Rhodobacteraceae bacterium]|nr:RNA polymerase sigma factor RpoD [Paracoccaceae bacterium]
MVSKATKADEEQKNSGGENADGPLIDLSDAAVKKMIRTAKKRGYVTYEELNEVLPSEQVSSEKIEDIMSMLSDMGINVIEEDEVEDSQEEAAEGGELVAAGTTSVAKATTAKEPTDRTDDPVRMYLREMGSVELLSREGEIAIAKRIEAGREAMISGLCESPLTFQAIIIWRDELNEGNVLLRDIIDLEATYAGPDGKAGPGGANDDDEDDDDDAETGSSDTSPAANDEAPAKSDSEGESSEGNGDSDDDDDDEFEANVSLSAMEAELKPTVVETFDNIADNYKKLRRLQDQLVENKLANTTLSPSQERRYKKLKEDIIVDVKSLSLNQNRIENLVAQLYDINKSLMGYEGRLLRLADSYNVDRADFLKQYQGFELDPNWLRKVANLSSRGWKNFVAKDKDMIRELRQEIQTLATETGLEITEFRKIVAMVQKGEREARIAKKEMVEANLR